MRQFIKKIIDPFLKGGYKIYLKKPRLYSYKTIAVWVRPTVFPPFLTFSTKILLEFVDALSLQNKKLLELGCGCGIISILAAQKGAAVTATDINQTALSALEKNACANGVAIDIILSDLFAGLGGKIFDYIIINPPYYPKNPASIAENAWFCGENFDYFETLFSQLPHYTSEDTMVAMILSEDCAIEKIKAIALKNGMAFELLSEKKVAAEKNFIFRIRCL